MAVAVETSQKFAEALNSKFEGREITATAGRKFDRIVSSLPNVPLSESAHAFVERETGKLYKAAGWKTPAKGIRYDLSNEENFAEAVALADPYGSYLYL